MFGIVGVGFGIVGVGFNPTPTIPNNRASLLALSRFGSIGFGQIPIGEDVIAEANLVALLLRNLHGII